MHSRIFANLYPNQRDRLERFGVAESVDIHCHCLPGLDDGPRSLDLAEQLCKLLAHDGITTVIATPHQLGRYDLSNSGRTIRQAVAALQTRFNEINFPMRVLPGGDVRVDERLPHLLDAGHVMTLGDSGAHVLLELPAQVWVEPKPIMRRLRSAGYTGIVSHPERYAHVQRRPEAVRAWLDEGVLLQVTAGSLTGDFGPEEEQTAWALVEAGHVALIATDAHHPISRPPRMTAALTLLRQRFGLAIARKLCLENPLTVLEHGGDSGMSMKVAEARQA